MSEYASESSTLISIIRKASANFKLARSANAETYQGNATDMLIKLCM